MAHSFPISPIQKPIQFGTDGWRGIIAADFTFERVGRVAPVAAQVLAHCYGADTGGSRLVIVGYDQRFMAEDFALTAATVIQQAGFEVLLSDCAAPTPAFSWMVKHRRALGAIVLTASHNPARYLGLKVKGAFGGSVPPEVTGMIEAALAESGDSSPQALDPQALDPQALEPQSIRNEVSLAVPRFNPWPDYCQALQAWVDFPRVQQAIAQGKLTVFVDGMHGAAAGGLSQHLGLGVQELRANRDPLFGGDSPEPLPSHLEPLLHQIRTYHQQYPEQLTVGLAFDGDGDRIAAVDCQGNFLSSQILIPILIEHLAVRRGLQGEVVKTISGSDLMPKVADYYQQPVYETAVGYKYIADRMLQTSVLLGGEESGGIGYGHHTPERDALLSALYILETVVQTESDLSQLYRQLQEKTGFISAYDRIDLPLANMDVRSRLLDRLQTHPLQHIAGREVVDCLAIDGFKFRLVDQSWLLIRFSGTEPVLRLYCEAATLEQVKEILAWAQQWANDV